jgi:hypothetical protein
MTRVEGAYAQLPPGYAFMGGHGEFFGGTRETVKPLLLGELWGIAGT